MDHTESELEKFRQQWREEVSARRSQGAKNPEQKHPAQPSSSQAGGKVKAPAPTARRRSAQFDESEEVEPKTYHDLKEKETGRKVGDLDYGNYVQPKEPTTALEHYERAVEKEGQGSLGDSVSLYRKAFRMDDKVHESYKKKHFPPSAFPAPKPANPNPSGAAVTVPNTAHHSLSGLPPTVSELISEFSSLTILGEPAPPDLSPEPPCPIATVPEEILTNILLNIAITDVGSLAKVALVCKRMAYLVLTEDSLWRRVVHGHEFGLAAMHYKYSVTVLGEPISKDSVDDENTDFVLDSSPVVAPTTESQPLSLTQTYPTYRQMFRLRPRIRFNGCYISTVNYTRPGANSTALSWSSPVLIVTYYRYLRFFRDGSVISLLTTSEPSDVVPYMLKEHLHKNHSGGLPQVVMKDALPGRWRLTGDPYAMKPAAEDAEPEEEGDVLIETEGVVPKYMYKMHMNLATAGRGARNNKLQWKGFWSWNRLTDDWAEFGMRNYKPYYWSRVRSYGMGL
jgi:F-box protein 9